MGKYEDQQYQRALEEGDKRAVKNLPTVANKRAQDYPITLEYDPEPNDDIKQIQNEKILARRARPKLSSKTSGSKR